MPPSDCLQVGPVHMPAAHEYWQTVPVDQLPFAVQDCIVWLFVPVH
jgi:hypothetical protein